jgi:hypothetical protein
VGYLIPENLRTRNDVPTGVNRLARVLQESLDDTSTIWYEPLFNLNGDRPDCVALIPDVGIIVLEVLEEKAGAIKGVKDHKFAVTKGGVDLTIDDPFERAQRFAKGLEEALDSQQVLSDSERLPVMAAGVLPYLSRSDGERKELGSVMPLERCIFRDELEAEPETFRRQLMRTMGGPLRDPLTQEAEKVHRAVIHPDTVIGSPHLPFASVTPAEELKVLDRSQEALAKGLGLGHRVVRGVAGSGKTLVLTYRARLLAESHPKDKVLIACYNRSLAGVLRRQLDLPNVEVRTIEWLLRRAHVAGRVQPMSYSDTSIEERARSALAVLDKDREAAGLFDHVLIDEAQDFTTGALAFAVRLLRPPSDSLLVVADAAQNIYRNRFRWKDAGINASGRTRVLDSSYRNTREILQYAHDFLMGGDDLSIDASVDDETAIIPPKLSTRSGPLPLFLHLESPQQEVLTIADRCRSLLDNGVQPSSIGVLYGASSLMGFRWADSLLRAFKSRDVPVFWATDPKTASNKDHIGEDPSKVVLSTIHSAKGLEFSNVMLCAYLDDHPPQDRLLTRRLIYVGMTRATQELVLTASGNHEYIADLEH